MGCFHPAFPETDSATAPIPHAFFVAAHDQDKAQSNKSRVAKAAEAAERMKHACTINEDELLALRPTLLKGYASVRDKGSR